MIYILQGRYTRAAMKGMLARPEDRSEQARGLFERAGAKMLGYYITLGEYDFLIIGEGDVDLQAYMGAIAVAASSEGLSDLKSTVAITAAEMKGAFEKGAAVVGQYRPPGQA